MTSTVELLTIEEVRDMLRFPSVTAVHAARGRGSLPPAMKVGGRLLWSKDTITEWLEAKEQSERATA